MLRSVLKTLACASMCLAGGQVVHADALFGPGTTIIAIDTDPAVSNSNYPAGEHPGLAIDGNTGTKYLNFAEVNTGLIVTPIFGGAPQSIKFTTANDADVRDPMTWNLFGTNDPIISGNNSAGDAENWTLIASGNTGLPLTRFTSGPLQTFANTDFYSSFRIVFPTVRNAASANSMQISEIQLYDDIAGVSPIFSPGDPVVGIAYPGPNSSYPGGEAPLFAIDGDSGTKYLNFGRVNSGFIVTPGDMPTIVENFVVTTANDAVERDPTGWSLYGTNDDITTPDNGRGLGENWTLIDSGVMNLPLDRFASSGEIAVNNNTPWMSYRMVFTGVRDSVAANSMQIADIQFNGSVVPEPVTLSVLGLAGLAGLARRRRRA